jgi:hypothetical protein
VVRMFPRISLLGIPPAPERRISAVSVAGAPNRLLEPFVGCTETVARCVLWANGSSSLFSQNEVSHERFRH